MKKSSNLNQRFQIGLLVLAASTSLFWYGALGAQPGNESVFVRLYTQRVQVAKAEHEREKAEANFRLTHVARLRELVGSGGVSRSDYDRAVADHQKSLAEIDVRKARIGEAEAELEVVRSLVENGQPVPLCR